MINDKRVTAIIPARALSVGLPGKNSKTIAGKSLVEWSIQAAIKSKYIDEIAVTTNDQEVRNIVYAHNLKFMDLPNVPIGSIPNYPNRNVVKIIDRPAEICGPDVSTEDAIRHAIGYLNKHIDIIVLLQPTSPARKNNLVDRCIEKLAISTHDSVFTVEKITPFLYSKNNGKASFMNKCNNEGKMITSPDIRPPRQHLMDEDMYYHDNGNVYCFFTSMFEKTGRRIGDDPFLMETDFFENIQIDSSNDFSALSALVDTFGGLL